MNKKIRLKKRRTKKKLILARAIDTPQHRIEMEKHLCLNIPKKKEKKTTTNDC